VAARISISGFFKALQWVTQRFAPTRFCPTLEASLRGSTQSPLFRVVFVMDADGSCLSFVRYTVPWKTNPHASIVPYTFSDVSTNPARKKRSNVFVASYPAAIRIILHPSPITKHIQLSLPIYNARPAPSVVAYLTRSAPSVAAHITAPEITRSSTGSKAVISLLVGKKGMPTMMVMITKMVMMMMLGPLPTALKM